MHLPVAHESERPIEDEEMPSMLTISGSSRIDESDVNIKQDEEKKFVDVENVNAKTHPVKQDDDDSDSVCVIDDDEDESDPDEVLGSSYGEGSSSYHDEEDEDEDSEDMDRNERRHYNDYGQ